jgi:uncharacterized protein
VISRRDLIKLTGIAGVGSTAASGYALAEALDEHVTSYAFTPPNWTPGLKLRLAVLADIHACDPWMSLERLERIVAQTNALNADAILLLGDYVAGMRIGLYSGEIKEAAWAKVLGKLKAPCGVHAVLGNHDWWQSGHAQWFRKGPVPAGEALEAAGIPVYENRAVRLTKGDHAFWVAGLSDQWAFLPIGGRHDETEPRGRLLYQGADDLPHTLSQITDDAPVILMAHEPDIFPKVPDRVALTLSGHTHGGQVRIFGFAPIVPSIYGSRYVYGHVVEEGRNLIVSGGLGCSSIPVRFGSPPEIVSVELGAAEAVA